MAAPLWQPGYPKWSSSGESSITFEVMTQSVSTVYFVVLSNGATAPSSAQVKAGTDANDDAVASGFSGSVSVTAYVTGFLTGTSLSSGTEYDAYFVADSGESENAGLQTTPEKVNANTDYVFYATLSNIVSVDIPEYKTCNKFVTIGWIKQPIFDNGQYMIPLAVEDKDGNMLTSTESLMFMLKKESNDYRFVFGNSESQLIRKSTGIKLEDENWHFLRWTCVDDDGNMKFFVDETEIPNRIGTDGDGLDYSIAYRRSGRIGGGDVWCPYLYAAGQEVTLYNWRFGEGFILPDHWVEDLMDHDKQYLMN